MDYFKITSIQERDRTIIIEMESYDTAILEFLIDRLNRSEDIAAAYEEIHPLTHQYRLIVRGKDPKEIFRKVLREALDLKF
ncbi:MAG: hypothetical protein N3C61_02215 [Candidatus Micrarchaeota archaeon]|nr:hypothetical protein [Candidatus Micrarchaeota archaeon]